MIHTKDCYESVKNGRVNERRNEGTKKRCEMRTVRKKKMG